MSRAKTDFQGPLQVGEQPGNKFALFVQSHRVQKGALRELLLFDLILLKSGPRCNFTSAAYLCVKSLKVAEYFKPRSRLLIH